MPARFFPFSSYDLLLERKALYMQEFKSHVPDSMPLMELFWMADRAGSLREARKKAIEDGNVPL